MIIRDPTLAILRWVGCHSARSIVMAVALLLVSTRAYAQPTDALGKLSPLDYYEIRNLYSAFSNSFDTGNASGLANTFTKDGTFSGAISKNEPEPIASLVHRVSIMAPRKRPVGTYHLVMTINVTATTYGARGQCYEMLYDGTRDDLGHFVGTPVYCDDMIVKTDTGWRFKSRSEFLSDNETAASDGSRK